MKQIASIVACSMLLLMLMSSVANAGEPADTAEQAKEVIGALVQSIFGSASDVELGKAPAWAPETVGPVSKELIVELARKLEDNDWRKRGEGATALGMIGPESRELIPELKARLKDKSGAVQAAAAGAIWMITGESEEMLPKLTGLLRGKHRAYHISAAVALGAVGPPARDAVPKLLDALSKDEYPGVRSAAAIALLKIGDRSPSVLKALEQAGSDKDATVRQTAAKVLEMLRSAPLPTVQDQSPSGKTILSGPIVYEADESALRYGVKSGPVGEIELRIRSDSGRAEGVLTVTITEKPYYAESEIEHVFTSKFAGDRVGTRDDGHLYRFTAGYAEKVEGAVSYESDGELTLDFIVLPENKATGTITGVSSWTPCAFTATAK